MIKIQGVQKKGNPYGFDWFLYGPNPDENVVIGHTGEQTGCSAVILIHRRTETVAVVLANTSGRLREVFMATNDLLNVAGNYIKDNK